MSHAAPSRTRRTLRVVIPALLVFVWLAAAAIGGPYFGRVGEVASNDPTAYLPTTAEATQVQERLSDFLGSDAIPAVVLVLGDTALDGAQLDELRAWPDKLAELPGVVGDVSPAIPSDDGMAVQLFVPIDSTTGVAASVEELRADLASLAPDGTEVFVTGPAGFTGDLVSAFEGIDGLLLLVALLAVFIILVIVYRSPLLPLIVLSTSVFALCVALLTVWWLAKAEVFALSGQTQGILFILVIGAATDYSLLYISRFREALRHHETRAGATREAIRGSLEPILASGGTVIAGLLMLLLSQLESNRALGPIASIGIIFSMLAALTLLPALLSLAGRVAFWPLTPRFDAASVDADPTPTKGIWARVPRFVERRARSIWIVSVLVMLVASVGLLQLKADGVPQSELVLGESEARTGQQLLSEHFPGGSGSPISVITQESQLQEIADLMLADDRIESVTVSSEDSPSGSVPVTEDGIQPLFPGAPEAEPTLRDGDVLLQGTLTVAADSAEAEDTVRELRTSVGDNAIVGGVTATAVDTEAASIRDRNLIIPLVLVVILLILMVLLRSIVAPILLVGTVVLSFAATMGVAAVVFNALGMPGADPAVPLFGFVFLVALGIDYNIFLMTRVREEALVVGARRGMSRGLGITGGVITSAGVVLAATFAALSVIPILFLLQLAFIVAFGVLLDTILVRSLLVPALGHELGRAMWWPSRKITS